MTEPTQDQLNSLPDPMRCQTRNMGNEDDPFECLLRSPNRCQFSLPAGKWVYCFHPDRKKFEKPRAKSDWLMNDASRKEIRGLPDPEICRTKDIHVKFFSECLVERPFECIHALALSGRFICNHPDRHKFEKPDPPTVPNGFGYQ